MHHASLDDLENILSIFTYFAHHGLSKPAGVKPVLLISDDVVSSVVSRSCVYEDEADYDEDYEE